MPRRKSSVKRSRADKKRHLNNLIVKRQLKETLKKFRELVLAKNIAEAKTLLTKAYAQLDKAAKKNIIHPRTANRKKSRLAKRINALKGKAQA